MMHSNSNSYHTRIWQKFYDAGYKDITKEGVCAGIIAMWLQATLTKKSENGLNKDPFLEEKKFLARLKLLAETDNIIEEIQKIKNKVIQGGGGGGKDEGYMKEMEAMMDTIYLHQTASLHSDLIGKTVGQSQFEEISAYTTSVALANELQDLNLKQIPRIQCDTLSLTRDEVQSYFDRLKEIISDANADNDLTITLSSGMHSFGLRRNNGKWMLVDPNRIEENIFNKQDIDDKDIAFYIAQALDDRDNKDTVFSINFFVSPNFTKTKSMLTDQLKDGLTQLKEDYSQNIGQRAERVKERLKLEQGKTVWHPVTMANLAARSGDLDTLKKLFKLEAQTDNNFKTYVHETTTLLTALGNYRPDVIKLFIEETPIENLQKLLPRKALIHYVAEQGDIEALKAIVKRSSALNIQSLPYGDTALHTAVRYGRSEIVDFLIQQDPKLAGIANSEGYFPVHIAAQSNQLEMLKHLSPQEMNTASKNTNETPLRIALMNKSWDVVVYLLNNLSYKDLDSNDKNMIAKNLKFIEGAFEQSLSKMSKGEKISSINQIFQVEEATKERKAISVIIDRPKHSIKDAFKLFEQPKKINGYPVSKKLFEIFKNVHNDEPNSQNKLENDEKNPSNRGKRL